MNEPLQSQVFCYARLRVYGMEGPEGKPIVVILMVQLTLRFRNPTLHVRVVNSVALFHFLTSSLIDFIPEDACVCRLSSGNYWYSVSSDNCEVF